MTVYHLDTNHPYLIEGLKEAGFKCVEAYDISIEELISKTDVEGIVIRSRFKLTSEILSQLPALKFIARVGAGMENIDVTYAESIGIHCFHAPEGNRDAVGEHAVAMLLNLLNRIQIADHEVRNGIWLRAANRGIELGHLTVGIIGFGNMGKAFAQRLTGFGCRIMIYDKYLKGFGSQTFEECDMQSLYDACDVISIHTPLTEETRYLIDTTFIQSFKKPIYIINTARGKSLKTSDLVAHIKSGKVKGACLDVLEYEPTSFEGLDIANAPEPLKYLIESDKVILTPHIAGWTHDSNYKMAKVLVDKIKAKFNS